MHATADNTGITLETILEHMQGMKYELVTMIHGLENRMDGLDNRMDGLDNRMDRLERIVHQGFEDARLHRQALQEDLEATILLQAKHGRKLARLEKR